MVLLDNTNTLERGSSPEAGWGTRGGEKIEVMVVFGEEVLFLFAPMLTDGSRVVPTGIIGIILQNYMLFSFVMLNSPEPLIFFIVVKYT